jgi:NTE family protein
MHGTRETAWARNEIHTKSHRLSKRPPFECIALLSQGARRGVQLVAKPRAA